MEEAFRKHENLDAWENTGLFSGKILCLPKCALRNLLIHGTFELQQQALITTADARFTAIYVSVNFFRDRMVLFYAFFFPLKDNFGLCLSHPGRSWERER